MSKSFYSILKSLEPLQKAKKAVGQFVEIPEWMKIAQNSDEPLTSSQRSQAKRILSGTNKISPSDMDEIIKTRNLDLMTFLAKKPDLSVENARKILDNDTPFARTRHYFGPGKSDAYVKYKGYTDPSKVSDKDRVDAEGWDSGYGNNKTTGKKDAVYNDLISKIQSYSPDAFGDFLKTGSEDAVSWVMNGSGSRSPYDSSRSNVRSDHMFHVITERPKIGAVLMTNMAQRPGFGTEHMVELMNRPESHLKRVAAKRMRGAVSPQIVSAAFRSGDPEFLKGLLSNSDVAKTFSLPQWSQLLRHQDERLRSPAHTNFARQDDGVHNPAALQTVQDDILQNSTPEDTKHFIDNMGYWNSNRKLAPDQAETLVRRLERDPSVFSDRISRAADLNPDQANRTIRAAVAGIQPSDFNSWRSVKSDAIYSLLDGDQLKGHITPETISAVLGTDPEFSKRLWKPTLRHTNVNEDHIRQIQNATVPMQGTSEANNAISTIASHPKSPTDVILKIASAAGGNIPPEIKKGFVSGDKLPRDMWEKLAFGDDPALRAAAAKSPHATTDDITKGLSDPDKEVRHGWMKHTPSGKISTEQWEIVKKDRSAINRAMSMSRSDVPADVLSHFLTKDKALGVNRSAINHPNTTPEMIDAAVKTMNPHNLATIGSEGKLSVDQNKELMKRLSEDRAVKLAKLNKQAADNKITPEDLTAGIDKIDNVHKDSMEEMSKHDNLDDESVHHMLAGIKPNVLPSVLNRWARSSFDTPMKPEHWDRLLDRPDLPASVIRNFMASARPTPERWRSLAEKLDPEQFEQQRDWHGIIATNHGVPDDVLDRFIDHGNPKFLEMFLDSRTDAGTTSSSHLNKIANKAMTMPYSNAYSGDPKQTLLHNLSRNQSLTPELAQSLYEHSLQGDSLERTQRIRENLVEHPSASLALIQRAMRDPHRNVADAAQEKMGQHDPDSVNNALGGHDIGVHPAVEKLKDMKGKIQEIGNGEPIPKHKLPNKGQGLPNEVFDAKGQISPKSIDDYIDKLPKDRYNITYTKWDGAQRHDRSKKQLVMQVNLTNKHVEDLKSQGLWPIFQKIHDSSYRSGHPVRKHSLGWARLDVSQPGHAHIDEIQSDLGQGSIRQIEQYAQNGRMDRAQANEYIDGIKKIIKTLSGQFKNINHAIGAAVHQTFRVHPDQLKGPDEETLGQVGSTSYDKLKDQAKQSGMKAEVNISPDHLKGFYNKETNEDSYEHRAMAQWAKKNGVEGNPEIGMEKFKEQHGPSGGSLDVPTPGFMQESYEQYPKGIGYSDSDKKAIMPDTQSPEETVQYRKLVKSLTKLKSLAKMLKEQQEKK